MLSMTRKRTVVPTPDPTADAITVPAGDEQLTVGGPLAQHVQSFDAPHPDWRDAPRAFAPHGAPHATARLRGRLGRAVRVRDRDCECQHRPREGQLALWKLARVARVAGACHSDPRLAPRAPDEYRALSPHPRAAPGTPALNLTRPTPARQLGRGQRHPYQRQEAHDERSTHQHAVKRGDSSSRAGRRHRHPEPRSASAQGARSTRSKTPRRRSWDSSPGVNSAGARRCHSFVVARPRRGEPALCRHDRRDRVGRDDGGWRLPATRPVEATSPLAALAALRGGARAADESQLRGALRQQPGCARRLFTSVGRVDQRPNRSVLSLKISAASSSRWSRSSEKARRSFGSRRRATTRPTWRATARATTT